MRGGLATAQGRGPQIPLAQGGGVSVLDWFNPDADAANRALIQARIDAGGFWAWRAQNSLGSPYLGGPGDYAASLVSMEGNAASLIQGNGIVPWTAAAGWGFVVGNAQWLDTILIPNLNPVSYAVLVQYSLWSSVGNTSVIGAWDSVGAAGALLIQRRTATNVMRLYHGTTGAFRDFGPTLDSGNYGLLAKTVYRNGIAEVPDIGPGAMATNDQNIYVGATSVNGVAAQFITANVEAVIVCDDATAVLPSIASLAAVGTGSMHNL